MWLANPSVACLQKPSIEQLHGALRRGVGVKRGQLALEHSQAPQPHVQLGIIYVYAAHPASAFRGRRA